MFQVEYYIKTLFEVIVLNDKARKALFCESQQSLGYWKGVGIAVLDTGIALHPDFYAGEHYRIAAFKDFVNQSETPYDDHGHGTHVCGICSGCGSLSKGGMPVLPRKPPGCGGKSLDQMGKQEYQPDIGRHRLGDKNQQLYRIRILNISVGSETDASSQVSQLLVKSAGKSLGFRPHCHRSRWK